MKNSFISSLAVGLFLLSISASQAQLITFPNAASLNAFVQTGPNAGNMTWQNQPGVGGVNGVVQATTGNTDQTLLYNTGFNWTLNPTYSTSIFFQYNGVDAGVTRVYAQIGFLDSNTGSYNGGGGNNYVSVRIRNSGGTLLEMQGQSANNGTATNVGTTTFNIAGNMVVSNWYLLSGTFNRLGSDQVSFSTSLTDYGSNGTVSGSTIASTSGTFSVGNGFYTDTAVFNGVRSTINSSQGYLDNYTVVPEPSTWLLAAGSLTCMMTFLRRRRRGS